MSGRNRLREIRAGFEPAFWIANVTELFERLSYYGQSAVLAIFLHESLHLSAQQTGSLMGAFGFAVWFLPVLGRKPGRSLRLSQFAAVCLPDPDARLFPDGFAGVRLDGAFARPSAAVLGWSSRC